MTKKELIVYFSIDLKTLVVKQCNIKAMINASFPDFYNAILNTSVINNTIDDYNYNVLLELLKLRNTSKTFSDKTLKKQFIFDINTFDSELVYCSVYLMNNNDVNSNIDYLTGIYNRAYLTKEFNNRVRNKKFETCALILIDLNNFKNVNDYFGHRVGDKVLREFTDKLATVVDGNLYGRYGGDEFIVFLENTTIDEISDVCKQILEISIAHEDAKHKIKVNCCLGVTISNVDDAQFEYLLEKADRALYKSKLKGKTSAFLDDECIIAIKPTKYKKTKKINKKFRLLNQEINYVNRKYYLISFTIIGLFILIFVSLIILMKNNTINTNYKEASNTMAMLSEEIDDRINTSIELYFTQLENLAATFDKEIKESISAKDLLKTEVDNYYFESIGILYKSGDIVFSKGTYNIAQEKIAEEIIINDKSYIDNIYFNYVGEYILVGIPYKNSFNENFAGICGIVAKDRFNTLLKSNVFDDETVILITKEEGSIIVNSSNYNLDYSNINSFLVSSSKSYEEVAGIIASGGKDTISVMVEQNPCVLYFAPISLSISNCDITWRLIIYTPTNAINLYTTKLYSDFMYLFSGVIIFLIVIIGCALFMIKHFKTTILKNDYIDKVTEGINLTRFNIDAEQLIKTRNDYAIIISNIIRFKYIHEQFGRQGTNTILKLIYDIMLENSSSGELVSRIYGDRFIMLFKNENIKTRIEQLDIDIVNAVKNNYGINPAIIYGIYAPDRKIDNVTYATNMARIALKKLDDNYQEENIAFYSKEMYFEELSNVELEQKFDSAIRNREFLVYYQAKRDIIHDTWNSSEALVRWKDSDEKIISPGRFIPLFEDNGYIITLDLYIFETVCNDLRKDINRGIEPLPVSVNLSKKHLLKDNFIDDFVKIINAYNIPPELIEFEFTESTVIENNEQLQKAIEDIHKIGCKCSIDDFGTGYSSLSMLSNFKFDVIKLDRSFFYKKDSFTDVDKIIVKAIIELAHNLNKKIVAEGIEEEELVEFLKQCNCDYIQGYYYAKPTDRLNFLSLTEK